MEKQKDNKLQRSWVFCYQSCSVFLSPDGCFLYQVKDCTSIRDKFQWIKTFQTFLYDFLKLQNFEQKLEHQFDSFKVNSVFISSDVTQAVVLQGMKWKSMKQTIGRLKNNIKDVSFQKNLKYHSSDLDKNIIQQWEIDNLSIMRYLVIQESELIIYKLSSEDQNKIYTLSTDNTIRDWKMKNNSHQIVAKLQDTFQSKFQSDQFILFSENLKYLMYSNDLIFKMKRIIKKFQLKSILNDSLFVQTKIYLLLQSTEEFIQFKRKKFQYFYMSDQEEGKYPQYYSSWPVSSISFSQDDQEIVLSRDSNKNLNFGMLEYIIRNIFKLLFIKIKYSQPQSYDYYLILYLQFHHKQDMCITSFAFLMANFNINLKSLQQLITSSLSQYSPGQMQLLIGSNIRKEFKGQVKHLSD